MPKKGLTTSELSDCFAHVYDVVNKEEPLPCALVCASMIERWLSELLRAHFVLGSGGGPSKTAEELLNPASGLLSSVSDQSKLAYCLGLIDRPIAKNIQTIATIRNRFAHSPAPVTFDDADVAKYCEQLTFPNPDRIDYRCITPGMEAKKLLDEITTNQRKYSFVAQLTARALEYLTYKAERCEGLESVWGTGASWPAD